MSTDTHTSEKMSILDDFDFDTILLIPRIGYALFDMSYLPHTSFM
jgi:hypothetical protein